MIREGRRLRKDVIDRLPEVVKRMSDDKDVIALYAFGSLA